MTEPSLTVNGRVVEAEELLKDYPEMEDYELLLGDDVSVEERSDNEEENQSDDNESEQSPEEDDPPIRRIVRPSYAINRSPRQGGRAKDNKVWSSAGKYSMKVTSRGYDYRGLPMISFLGRDCPDYDRIDRATNESLRIQMKSRLGRWRTSHPQAGIVGDDEMDQMSMFSLDTYYNETEKTIESLNYGPMYKKTMVGVCYALEKVAVKFGFEVAENFTASQIEMLPVIDMISTNYALTNGAGPLSGMDPATQIGAFATLSFLVYMGVGYYAKDPDQRSTIYKMISGTVSEQAVDAVRPSRPPPHDAPVPSPFDRPDPAAAKPQNGILGMVQKGAQYAQMLATMTGGNKKTADDKKGATKGEKLTTPTTERAKPKERQRVRYNQ